MIELSRRQAIKLGFAGLSAGWICPSWPATTHADDSFNLSHGASPLGTLSYPAGFSHFPHRSPNAPKGGTLRLARVGAFDTLDTLRYPGRPPADMRVIYDRLVVPSPDEPASYYGHLAEGVAISYDFSRVTFRLSPDVPWHDGTPLTADDVLFTFETLKTEGAPFYRQSYRAVRLEQSDDRTVTFINDGTPDRDLISGLASLPIHPAHRPDPPGPDDLPLGSGPYRLIESDAPSRIVLERVTDYWAEDQGTAKGAFNFDRISIRYYRDADVAFEAFRAGEYDARVETNPSRWRSGYDDLDDASPAILRATTPSDGPGRLHGLVMNLRSGPLADIRVRKALHLSFSAPDAVDRLFGGFFQPVNSLFENTAFAAVDFDALADTPPPGTRDAARLASQLLDAAGFVLDGIRRIDPETGEPIRFSAVSTSPLYDGVLGEVVLAFERLGIELIPQVLEPSIAARQLLDRNFDIATLAWAPGKLPGSAERLLWHSDLANRSGSYALSGLQDPDVDGALDALSAASTLDEAIIAGQSVDRLLRASLAYLPLWRDGETRLAWREGISCVDAPELGRSPNFLSDWRSDDA
ncbi:MAG: ABC transporter substrate-binding protein [Devosiaceae bacterium]|nr:ABC transporter substrate-binding protein [Devosiaceae bacterium MH13]